ncbi:MAG: D-alanyl-D-alanine carboxypeptidase [Clostridia bacterium]|nr:D-alanyl-D-alanine carboxypeptidase [Clostridia bacterium]
MRKIISVLLCVVVIFSFDNAKAISAKSAVLIDSASGRVLYEKNAHEKLPMASTTKIMTGLLACESGKMKEISVTSPVASGTEGSSLWLKIGEKQTLENLTYGLMLKSGNDAAIAIAEHLCGNISAFSLKMTQRAQKIKAFNTQFKNPNGLDAEGHYTTAYDLALISREAMKNELFRKIVSTKKYSIPMEGEEWDRALTNHNKMLWRYEGCNGIKTGYTKKCGRCLVTSAERDGSLICVTLNAPDDWNDHTELLNFGFENFNKKVIFKKGEKVAKFFWDAEKKKGVPLVCREEVSIMMKSDENYRVEIDYLKPKLPITEETVCAVAHISVDGEELYSINLYSARNITEKKGIISKVFTLMRR